LSVKCQVKAFVTQIPACTVVATAAVDDADIAGDGGIAAEVQVVATRSEDDDGSPLEAE
jgi:hypothetical protein